MEGLINHLIKCTHQPQDVRTKAQLQKHNAQSPRNSRRSAEANSSSYRHPGSPYPSPQLPSLHVQTPSESYQSPYTLSISRPSSHMSHERMPSVVSSSSSSLTPFDSISVSGGPPSSHSRRRGRITPFNSHTPLELAWSNGRQTSFEERITRLTVSAGLPLSWVENPEWLDFCTELVPQAKSPSCKVLTRCLLPQTLAELQSQAKERASGQNATASCDGWMGENFHHYIVFMVMVNKEVHHSSTVAQ
jgi:hypothetical protein